MKNIKKAAVICILALGMVLPFLTGFTFGYGVAAPAGFSLERATEDTLVWRSSFENAGGVPEYGDGVFCGERVAGMSQNDAPPIVTHTNIGSGRAPDGTATDFPGRITGPNTVIHGGSTPLNAGYSIANLFNNHHQGGNKFISRVDLPVWFGFSLPSAEIIRSYALTAANDGGSGDWAGRDPRQWTLYAHPTLPATPANRHDAGWIELHSMGDAVFGDNFMRVAANIDNNTPFQHFRLEITDNAGGDSIDSRTVQFSLLELSTLTQTNIPSGERAFVELTQGPAFSYFHDGGVGWDGYRVLTFGGTRYDSGTGRAAVRSYHVVYEGLNIPVIQGTELSYFIKPSPINVNSFDFEVTSNFSSVDLRFTDGTYLSSLNAIDQNGVIVSPRGQGEGRTLITLNWNRIYSDIGEVAAGKTIDALLVGFDHNNVAPNASWRAYFDEITITNRAERVFDSLLDFVETRRGTNSSDQFSRGQLYPLTQLPHGFHAFVPVTDGLASGAIMNRFQSSGTTTYSRFGGGQITRPNNTLSHISVGHFATTWDGVYGTWQFMANTSIDVPGVADPNTIPWSQIDATQRWAPFRRENEIARAHYYSVTFDEGISGLAARASGVQIEVVPTMHAGVVRFTFPEGSAHRNIIFDSERGRGSTPGSVIYHADGTFTAHSDHMSSHHNGFVSPRKHIAGRFVDPATGQNIVPQAHRVTGNRAGIASFDAAPTGPTVIEMHLAGSFISAAQARHNLSLDISATDNFESVKQRAGDLWLEKLSIITDGEGGPVVGATHTQKVTLYSNLYRMFTYPTLHSENMGTNANPIWRYASPYNPAVHYNNTNRVPVIRDGIMHTNNGFWDTFRTTWPAYTIFTPNHTEWLLEGILQHYHEWGWIGRWLAPGALNLMVGTSSDIVFADAMVKGINFDWEAAFSSALRNGSVDSADNRQGRRDLYRSNFYGFNGVVSEGFSWAIENYLNDFGIAVMAEILGHEAEHKYFLNRSLGYVNYFYAGQGGHLRGRYWHGGWIGGAGWDPQHWWGPYTETNSWNMSFTAQHDPVGLVNLYGGRDNFNRQLDTFFSTPDTSVSAARAIHEMVGARDIKLGQLGMNNQPSFHIPYMYLYAGRPYMTQRIVRDILDRLFVGADIGQGFMGDEDNGSMAAWHVLSSLGFFPLSPATGEYVLGSPLFERAVIRTDNDTTFTIIANNNSRENVYVQSVNVNGTAHDKFVISHDVLTADGAVLKFNMGDTPSNWARDCYESGASSITPWGINPYYQIQRDMTDGVPVGAHVPGFSGRRVHATNIGTSGFIGRLFSNNSRIVPNFISGTSHVYFMSDTNIKINSFTVTGGTVAATPTTVRLMASNDFENWTEVYNRQGNIFAWANQTIPFLVEAQAFKYYRLELARTGSGNLGVSEIEFFGHNFYCREALNSALNVALLHRRENYSADSWGNLDEIILSAQAVADNPRSTEVQISQAMTEINSALFGLENIVNRNRLNAAVLSAQELLSAGELTVEDRNAVTTVINSAIAVRDNIHATQIEVDEKAYKIERLVDGIINRLGPNDSLEISGSGCGSGNIATIMSAILFLAGIVLFIKRKG